MKTFIISFSQRVQRIRELRLNGRKYLSNGSENSHKWNDRGISRRYVFSQSACQAMKDASLNIFPAFPLNYLLQTLFLSLKKQQQNQS